MTARTIVAVGAASVVLGVATTGLIALASGGAPPASASCEAPALAGAVVNVSLTDMGDMMGPGMMGPSGHMRGMGMMRITADPATVSAGQISLRTNNFGALTHEVVILPLAPGQWPGQRAIGADGEVDESGSVGEASRTCGADEGEGHFARGERLDHTHAAAGTLRIAVQHRRPLRCGHVHRARRHRQPLTRVSVMRGK